MNKAEQVLAWACLPKEAREEIKMAFNMPSKCGYSDSVRLLLSYIFGHHNLTSDIEPPELLFLNRKTVQEVLDMQERAGNKVTAMVLKVLFGDKCRPDKELNEDNFAKSKPSNVSKNETKDETLGNNTGKQGNSEKIPNQPKDNMEENVNKTYYKSEDWLNGFESPSTGSVVCYDGWRDYSDGPDRCTFIEVADCQQKIRLHKAQGDAIVDFINKATKMRNALDCFITHLKTKQ